MNRGLVSPLALSRKDIEGLNLSAETFDNWMPRRIGSMMLRPGGKFLHTTLNNNAAKFLPFVFSTNDLALVELTNNIMRVSISDSIITRGSVTTTITDGNFNSLAGWTISDEAGASSTVSSGNANLTGTGKNAAIITQQITVSGANINAEHALKIVVNFGQITFRVGTSTTRDEYINETVLEEGTHSLVLTPSGDFFIHFSNRRRTQARIADISIESSGDMSITTPWATSDLPNIRYDGSGDVIFIACKDTEPYKIERRAKKSWSVVKYITETGPLEPEVIKPISVTPNTSTGIGNLTASGFTFSVAANAEVGRVIKITSPGQGDELDITAENTFTDAIKVQSINDGRIFTLVRSGTWVATVTIQRSFYSDEGPWEDLTTTYTTNGTATIDDTFDNQIIWYRAGVKTGNFTSGTVELVLNYENGETVGYIKVFASGNASLLSIDVLKKVRPNVASFVWQLGDWTAVNNNYPTSVAITEGRLVWAGKDKIWLSASDDFYNFDDLQLGDSAYIQRTIGSGPIDNIEWLLSIQELLMGTEGTEFSCRSSGDQEPLTPSNFNIKNFSTYGSGNSVAVKVDDQGVFVQRGGTRLMGISQDGDKFTTADLSVLYPESGGDSNITHIAVQRQPDTRIHCMRADGTVLILVHNKLENMFSWVKYSGGGSVEDVVILPGADGDGEDAVYYQIKRTINAVTVRHLEKWSLESQNQGATVSRQLDDHVVINQASSTTIGGLGHLEGETVALWANGKDLGTYTVSSSAITASEAVTQGCVGLPYTAQWKSSKLDFASNLGTALLQKKKIHHFGVVLYNTHYQGMKYGPGFSSLDQLPLTSKGADIAADTVHTTFDEELFEFPSEWDTDPRICLQAASPRPCTILSLVFGLETHDKY